MGLCSKVCSSFLGDVLVWITRIAGLSAVVACWGVAAEVLYYGHYLGYVLLAIAVVLTPLEVVFGINYCVQLCCSVDTACRRCWDCVLWLDDWKKATLYLVLAVPCFVQPGEVRLAVIVGIMLIFSSVLYLLKTFKTRADNERKTLAQTPSYDKFEEVHEEVDLDDDDDDDAGGVITNPGTISISMDNDIGDQQEILEV
ncbi:uncharacterized protein LOC127868735 [Dreissena polymorpha]|uniref:Transmembrane protein 72 n=1 Tax=Dreissena polymorpha TaxID=45954 RepID=A0A9D4RM01_DREPO|nr:uncharacterized protein LOC127868735 [Dreissena polymorpha]KAH3872278.1 hypothetical protein DPMN_035493 [Dreissena polymorpha]